MTAHGDKRAAGSQDRGLEIPSVYRFDDVEDLLEGWQSHVATQRIIHEESARSMQTMHHWVGGAAAVLAALAGSSGVAAWQSTSTNGLLTLLTALMGTAAAVCAGMASFLDLGGRAQRHRAASVAYKRLLRELEATTAPKVPLDTMPATIRQQVVELGDALAQVDAEAPIPPRRRAEAVRRRGRRRDTHVGFRSPRST